MRKTYIIFIGAMVAATCAMSSCADRLVLAVKDVQSEISFEPVAVSNSSKLGIIPGSVFPEDESFDVSCVFLPNRDGEGHATYEGAQPLFAATPVTKTGDYWKTADRYFWPLTGGIKFLCFYPTSDILATRNMFSGISVNPADFTGSYNDFTIHHTDADNNDITVESAKNEDNLSNARVDFMTSSLLMNDIENRSGDVVPVQFAHNLSQIRFKIKAAEDFSDCDYRTDDNHSVPRDPETGAPIGDWDHANVNHVKIWVDRIELENIYSRGDYFTNAPNWPKEGHLGQPYRYVLLSRESKGGTCALYRSPDGSKISDDCVDYPTFGIRTPEAVSVMKGEDDPLAVLLIPQRIESGAVLRITYTIEQENKREYDNGTLAETDPAYRPTYLLTDYTGTLTKELKLADISPIWSIATCYTYTIVVGLDAIEVIPAYDEWNFDGSQDTVI